MSRTIGNKNTVSTTSASGIFDLREQELYKLSNTWPSIVEPIVFSDNFESYTGWLTYGTGTVSQSSTRAYEGTFSLIKSAGSLGNGGYKILGVTLTKPYTLEYWAYSVSPRTALSDRVSIVDSNNNGYGVSVSDANSKIERVTGINNNTSIEVLDISTAILNTRTDNVWYRVKFTANADNTFTLTTYNLAGTVLVNVTSSVDTTTTSFDRILIAGGNTYHIDNIRIWNSIV